MTIAASDFSSLPAAVNAPSATSVNLLADRSDLLLAIDSHTSCRYVSRLACHALVARLP
jgi:hypothetical protein